MSEVNSVLDYIVIDAGCLIKGHGLEFHRYGKEFWSVKECIAEIRDLKSRMLLESLPFEIKLKEPSVESMKAVSNFARLTGDFAALSLTDLKLMALTYEFECQVLGDSHIRKEPLRKLSRSSEDSKSGAPPGVNISTKEKEVKELGRDDFEGLTSDVTSIGPCCGNSHDNDHHNDHHNSEVESKDKGDGLEVESEVQDELATGLDSSLTFEEDRKLKESVFMMDDDQFPSLNPTDDENSNMSIIPSNLSLWKKAITAPKVENVKSHVDPLKIRLPMAPVADSVIPANNKKETSKKSDSMTPAMVAGAPITDSIKRDHTSRILSSSSNQTAIKDFKDDGQGWITSDNIRKVKAGSGSGNNDSFGGLNRMKGSGGFSRHERVACLTNDFSMQNVLIQMNLHILSLDGMIIRKVKQWVLRCNGCRTVQYDMDKLFCRKCGGSHLSRVGASVDSRSGEMKLHLKKDYKHDLRGMKYSMPAPGKQGKYEGELLLREDQLLGGAWRQKVVKISKDVRSAFGDDIVSDLGMHVNKGTRIRVGLGSHSSNPNARKGRERRGKGKKK